MAIQKDTANVIEGVSYKNANGTMEAVIPMAASGSNVYLTNADKTYSAQQFFDNYMSYMNSGRFIAIGKTAPKATSKFPIWIDTSN
ncbi:MAG TPA: hypothetical protein DCW90_18320 [Lachnospiraceae bacterium]|nr:hypothetical protein [Lachnospiraceae bacterium]